MTDRISTALHPRIRAATLAAMFLVLAAAAPAQTLDPAAYAALPFRFIGPPGNRVNAVAGVAGRPEIVYAGTPSGGIFKSDDGGLHWKPVFDAQHVMSIGALAVASSDPDVVWAGTGDPFIRPNIEIGDGVYRSTDAGKTWTHAGLEQSGRIGRIVIDPKDPNTVFVAAMGHCYGPQPERGVFRTKDGGRAWEKVLFVDENTGAIDVAIDRTNPKVVFAATWQLAIHPWYSENGGPGSGLHVSRDGGTTWTRLSGHGLPAGPLGRIGIALSQSQPKRVYALIETNEKGNLWRSDDAGLTWTVASADPVINRRARYFSRIGVSTDNADEVYFLAQDTYVSRDAGRTTTTLPAVFPDAHDIWIDPTDARRVLIANDRYVNLSSTRGRAFLRSPLPATQVNRVAVDRRTPYNVYASRQDGPSYRGPSNSLLRDSGVSSLYSGTGIIPPDFWVWTIGSESGWTMPDRADDNIVWASSLINVERVDMRTGMILPGQPFPRRDTPFPPGGVAAREFRLNWTIPMALSPHDPRRIYAGSQYVHESADAGRTWTVISPDLTTNDKARQQVPPGLYPESQDVPCSLVYIEESPIEPGLLWTGSNDGQVHVTRDGGATWTNVTANIPGLGPWGAVYSIAPSRHAFGSAYVSVDRHRAADTATYVFKTEDYGRTWTSIGGAVPRSVFSYARVVREDPRRKGMLYLGTENALYLSVDDGATWLPLQNNLPHSPIAWLTVQEDFDDLVVGTWGRGIWILDDIGPLRALSPAVLGSEAHLFQPRPAYRFALHDPTTSESFATEFDTPSHAGRNPPYGADLTYYLAADALASAEVTILDAKGGTVRTLSGPHEAGLNRVWWDLRGAAPPPREGAPGRAPGRQVPPLVAPGTYTVRVAVAGQVLETTLTVRRDPAAPED